MKLLALVTVAFSFQAATSAHAQDPRERQVDSLFAEYTRAPSPGLAVAVVRDGQVIFRKGYGLADLEHNIPITPATVFDVASVSKQFAGLATAMLVNEGKLKLSDDITKYIPELSIKTPVTVEHLVHHTSGFRDWPGTLAVAGWSFDDVISFRQILDMAYNQQSLNFAPGAEYFYSNTGYNLLTEIIQRVTKKSFREWTDENFFKPLGMTSTVFRDDHTMLVRNRAFGYARAQGGFRHTPNNLTALGSSSMFSSVDDLARWLINFDEGRVGGGALALFRTTKPLNNGTANPYAFGVSHGTHRGLPTIGHSGSWASFRTHVVHFPQQKAGVVVLANGNWINATEAAMKVAGIYLDKELAAVPAEQKPSTTTVTVPIAQLEKYVGLYRLGPGWYLRVRREGNALTAQATREQVVQTTPRSEREFWIEDYGAPIVFGPDTAGRVMHLTYRGIRAPRIDDTGPTTPPTRLSDYVGEYESPELKTIYTVSLANDTLQIHHRRHGTHALSWTMREEFGTNLWFLKSIDFKRDSAGRVTGLVINGDARSRDIRFIKRR